LAAADFLFHAVGVVCLPSVCAIKIAIFTTKESEKKMFIAPMCACAFLYLLVSGYVFVGFFFGFYRMF